MKWCAFNDVMFVRAQSASLVWACMFFAIELMVFIVDFCVVIHDKALLSPRADRRQLISSAKCAALKEVSFAVQ